MGVGNTNRGAIARHLPRSLLALLMTTGLVTVVSLAMPAYAQTSASGRTARAASFAIPAQSLSSALVQFSNTTGVQLFFDADLVRDKASGGAHGALTRSDALQRILAGTGLVARVNGNTVTIFGVPTGQGASVGADGSTLLETITIEGDGINNWDAPPAYAGGQVATGARVGMLGNLSVMDTPFNQTSYTAKRIQDTQASTVAEVLQDNPSVRTLVNGDRSSFFEQVTIRGLRISSYNYLFDGLPGMLPYNSTTAELAERVEVLSGPSTLINGMPSDGAVGGTVNIVPKRAGEAPLTEFNTFYRSNGTIGEHVDFARRYGDNEEFGIRFNGVYGGGETNTSDQDKESSLAALGLDYKGERLRLSADLGYQSNKTDNATISNFYLADGVPVPSAFSGRHQAVSPWTFTDTSGRFGVVRGEFDALENLTLYGAYGASESRFSTNTLVSHTILNTNGDFVADPYALNSENRRTSAQLGMRWNFDTGPVSHRVALQYDRTTLDTDAGLALGQPVTGNLDDLSNIPNPGLQMPSLGKNGDSTYYGVSALYSASIFDERLLVMGGLRKQYVDDKFYNIFTHELSASYEEDALSPMVAFSVKPWENVALYANYSEGLSPGTTVPVGFANAGTVLAPFETKQMEAGVKAEWGDFTTTLSVFEITQPSQRVNVASNTLSYDGEQRNRGIELNVFGQLTESVRVLGGLMLLDARLTKTQGGVDDDKIAVSSPKFQANIGAEWDTPFITGLSLSGRVTFTSAQYYDTAEPRREIPSWTRVDVGGRYEIERENAEPITIRFNVDNVLDNDYWASTTYGLIAGEGRTFKLSTSFRF